MTYLPRVIDGQLQRALAGLPAVAVEGAKAIGKSSSAERVAGSALRLDQEGARASLRADVSLIERLEAPVLIDEWQRHPPVWDAVRRAVDADRSPGRFVLTGSANPADAALHSGAGRIARLRMRPLSFAERGLQQPTVSLRALAEASVAEIGGETRVGLMEYVDEILMSGLPGVRSDEAEFRDEELDSYLDYTLSHEVPALGVVVRRPSALRAWLRAYAAATAGTASFEAIADAVSKDSRPTRATLIDYREALTQLWLLDEVPAWAGGAAQLNRLGQASKHHLVDPALAARLLRLTRDGLVMGSPVADDRGRLRSQPLLGALFESLVTLSVRVYAGPLRAEVTHLRTHRGEREVDLLVELPDGRVVAIEVKLAESVGDHDVRHLIWLRDQFGERVVALVAVTTGRFAYRRPDGVAVVPLALLGP